MSRESSKEPNTFVFDLDGTLIDSTPGIKAALEAAFQAIGQAMPEVDLRTMIGPPIGIIARRVNPSLTDADIVTIERVYRRVYDQEAWRATELFAGVAQTLRALYQAGHRLFVVTNKPMLPTTRILEHFELLPLFVQIVTRDSASPPFLTKTAMVADLMNRNHLSHDSTVMVGDTTEDGQAAEANHLEFIFMTYGYGQHASAGRTLNHFSDLLVQGLI